MRKEKDCAASQLCLGLPEQIGNSMECPTLDSWDFAESVVLHKTGTFLGAESIPIAEQKTDHMPENHVRTKVRKRKLLFCSVHSKNNYSLLEEEDYWANGRFQERSTRGSKTFSDWDLLLQPRIFGAVAADAFIVWTKLERRVLLFRWSCFHPNDEIQKHKLWKCEMNNKKTPKQRERPTWIRSQRKREQAFEKRYGEQKHETDWTIHLGFKKHKPNELLFASNRHKQRKLQFLLHFIDSLLTLVNLCLLRHDERSVVRTIVERIWIQKGGEKGEKLIHNYLIVRIFL